MNIEEDIKNLKTYIELVIEKNYCDCNELNTICYGKYGDGSKNVAKSIENVLTAYEKEKEKNKKSEEKIKKYINKIQKELDKYKIKNTNTYIQIEGNPEIDGLLIQKATLEELIEEE